MSARGKRHRVPRRDCRRCGGVGYLTYDDGGVGSAKRCPCIETPEERKARRCVEETEETARRLGEK